MLSLRVKHDKDPPAKHATGMITFMWKTKIKNEETAGFLSKILL